MTGSKWGNTRRYLSGHSAALHSRLLFLGKIQFVTQMSIMQEREMVYLGDLTREEARWVRDEILRVSRAVKKTVKRRRNK